MTPPKRQTPGLRRALLLEALRNRRGWAAFSLLAVTLLLLMLAFLRIPASIRFVPARIDSITPLHGDMGSRPLYTATGPDGEFFPAVARSPAAPALLAPGDRVCLRVQTDRFTGRVTARHAPENPECKNQPRETQ